MFSDVSSAEILFQANQLILKMTERATTKPTLF
jgi:hypothetical protein